MILAEGDSSSLHYTGLDEALHVPDVQVRLFGKPEVKGQRRMGVVLARAENLDDAVDTAKAASGKVVIHYK